MDTLQQSFSEYHFYDILNSFCTDKERIETEPRNLGLKTRGTTFFPDIYLPDGCKALGLKPNTIVEVKARLSYDTLQILRLISDVFYPVFQDKGYHFLCILMVEDRSSLLDKKEKGLMPGRINDDFQVKTIKELLEDAGRSYRTTNDLGYEKRQQLTKENALSAIKTNKCSFILGAGVSVDAKLPKWDALLKSLIAQANRKYGLSLDDDDYKILFDDCGSSSIILGRLVHTLFNDDDEEFKRAVRIALYKGSNVKPGDLAKSVCSLIKYKHEQNSLTSVITYNYDDLIELGLKDEDLICVPVTGSQQPGVYIPVYHVHGYLPQNEDSLSTVVLSEKNYHDIYMQAYHWSNVEQLHAMQRSVCFFIGLSMTDPNLRRLLDIAYGERSQNEENVDIRHFAFLRRKDVSKDLKGNKAEEFRSKMEDMLKGFGVAVLWYDNYEDLPKLLNELIIE